MRAGILEREAELSVLAAAVQDATAGNGSVDHPAVLVVEDVHWADDATLDALRYLIRRIARLPAVLILTYRDDELGREHALGGLLGQACRSDPVRRLPLRRLSADAARRITFRHELTRRAIAGAVGAQAGEEPLGRLAADAGFARFGRVAETPFNIVYEARR